MVQISPALFVEDLINDPKFNSDEYEGYVYMITNKITGKKYIGKKNFRSSQNKKLGKKELAALPVTRGRTPSKKKVIKESDWKTYYGSSKVIQEDVKTFGVENFFRVVLHLCKGKKELTYFETKCLFTYNVLENEDYYNDNILGSFYRKDLIRKAE